MKSTINCFIPYAGAAQAERTVQGLQATGLVKKIYLLVTSPSFDPLPGCELLYVDKLTNSASMYAIATYSDASYTLLYTKYTSLELVIDDRGITLFTFCHLNWDYLPLNG